MLATVCDLTIAAETAIFGQVGPRMGSVDPGFGTAYLSRIIGEKKARKMWYLRRRYSAAEAVEPMPRMLSVSADESKEGGEALREKRDPEFRMFT